MNMEQSGILAVVLGSVIILGGVYTAKIIMVDVPSASQGEYRRMVNDQTEVTKVKCTEPRAEFRFAETEYLKNYNLLHNSESKYDILSSTEATNLKQVEDANQLKIIEDISIQSCIEAKAENIQITPAGNWNYFKANWKVIMFNVKR